MKKANGQERKKFQEVALRRLSLCGAIIFSIQHSKPEGKKFHLVTVKMNSTIHKPADTYMQIHWNNSPVLGRSKK